jgi:deoxyribonuclease-4
MLLIGHHVSDPTVEHIVKDINAANVYITQYAKHNPQKIQSAGITGITNIAQIFNIGPKSYRVNNVNRPKVKQLTQTSKVRVYIHASYMINIKGSPANKILGLIELELHKGMECGATGVVFHVAKCSTDEFIAYVDAITKKVSDIGMNIEIIFEAKASNGFNPVNDIDSIIKVCEYMRKITSVKHRICLDTAHMWAYGHNIADIDVVKDILARLSDYTDIITMLQFNDSHNTLGSGKDQHQVIGKGHIFTNAMPVVKEFVVWCIKNGVAIIFERGGEFIEDYKACFESL